MEAYLQIVDVKKGFNCNADASHEFCRQPFTLHFWGVMCLLSTGLQCVGLAQPYTTLH